MSLNLNPHSGIPLYRQIAQQLRASIISGKLAGGAQIPSARELSAQLKVNPITIQKVYQILEHEELVETRRGLGTFVVQRSRSGSHKEKLALLYPAIQQLVTEATSLEVESPALLQEVERQYKLFKPSERKS